MRAGELGEFGMIALFRELLPAPGRGVMLGSGDDAAVLKGEAETLLFAVDAMVEGVHFDLGYVPWDSVGYKALASNLSDLAAMGGCDKSYAVVAIGARGDTKVEDLEELQGGILRCGGSFHCELVGGDLVASPGPHFAVVAVLGFKEEGTVLLTRGGAREGDLVLVTGTLGDSYLGWLYLRSGGEAGHPCARRHLYPEPRLREGDIASRLGASAAIDISDGFIKDLGHVCEESGLGAEVYLGELPLSPQAMELAEAVGEDPYQAALSGGEDYELIIIAPKGAADEICRQTGAKMVGKMVRGEGVRVFDQYGKPYATGSTGYEHLR